MSKSAGEPTRYREAPPRGARFHRHLRWLEPLVGVGLFALALVALHRELHGHGLREISRTLNALPATSVVAAIGLAIVGYGILTFYDYLAVRYAERRLPYRTVAPGSFVTYALSHNLGMATMIFSDVLNVGDMVDLSGQSGRVEQIGLRFTTLVNVLGQEVYVPNRNIAQIGRYRKGVVRAYVDVQFPEGCDENAVTTRIREIARGMHAQHDSVLLTEPQVLGVFSAEPGGWKYVRLKFRLWPGQGALIEQTFKQRALAALRRLDAGYGDWMITVTYGID